MAETHEDDYDPYLETFAAIGTQDKQKKNVNEVVVEPATSLPPQVTVKNSSKNQNEKFEYWYQIILNNNEDGLMESFLKEPITDEKTRSDPSDFFNFGLDEEKWRKLLNHSILMHYERHFMKDRNEQDNITNNINPQRNYYKN